MRTLSFWLDAPRDHFAQQCMDHFQTTFASASWIEYPDKIPDRSRRTAVYPGVGDAVSRSKGSQRRVSTQIAQRAMKDGTRFLGVDTSPTAGASASTISTELDKLCE